MKQTKEIESYIIETMDRASKFMGVRMPDKILFDGLTMNKALEARNHSHKYKNKMNRLAGFHSFRRNAGNPKRNFNYIFINVKKFKSIKRMNLTIIHELLHLGGRHKHTNKFYLDIVKIANQLFDGGNPKEEIYTYYDLFKDTYTVEEMKAL